MKRFLPGLRAIVVLLLPVALLSGCATSYLLDNNVQSFSNLSAVPAGATYRFDRLPSQQATPDQGKLEELAGPALAQAGLKRDDAAPKFGVEVRARAQRVVSPWSDPWDVRAWGGRRHWGWGFGGPFPRLESPWYHREITLIVRELGSNRVVYETHAVNDGPWSDSLSVLPAMFQAALQGFPNPPQGVRRVDIQVGS